VYGSSATVLYSETDITDSTKEAMKYK